MLYPILNISKHFASKPYVLKPFTSKKDVSKHNVSAPFILSGLFSAMSCTLVYASEPILATSDTSNVIPELVITPSKTLQAINTTPADVRVISAAALTQIIATDLPSLLREQSNLHVVSSGGLGQLASIFSRGSNSSHTLMLQDGVRLNSATSSAANVQWLDVSDIDHIEIVQGPASVQYGSDAIGGVVQLVSKIPTKSNASATIEAGEQGTYKGIASASLVKNDAYLQLSAQRLESDGATVASNTPSKSGYEQKGFSIKTGVNHQDYQLLLEAKQNQGTSEYMETEYLPPDYMATEAAKSQAFKQQLFRLKASGNVAEKVKLAFNLSQFNDNLQQMNTTDFNRTSHNEADVNLQWAATKHQNILLGFNTLNTNADVLSYGAAYTGFIQSQALYAQHQYHSSKLNSQVGIRSTHNVDYGWQTVGQTAVRLTLIPTYSDYSNSIYTNLGTAFHAPDVNQKYSLSGNPNLQPEQSKSAEIGFDQQLGSIYSAHINGFYTDINHLITYTAKYPYTLANINQAQIYGSQLVLKANYNNGLFAHAHYDYTHAIDVNTKVDLPRRPHHRYGVSFGLAQANYGASVDIIGQSPASETVYDSLTYMARPASVDSHVAADLHGFYQLNKNLRIFANVLNVGNNRYATAYKTDVATYLAQPRQASVGLKIQY